MNNVTITIVLDSRRKTKKGYPVKLRLTDYTETFYISLKRYFDKPTFVKIMNGKRLSQDEMFIRNELKEIEIKSIRILNQMNEYSFAEFRDIFDGKRRSGKDKTLVSLFNNYIDELRERESYNNALIYNNALMSLEGFKSGININKITPSYLRNYEKYMLSNGKSKTTVSLYLRSLRAIFNRNKDLFTNYPFESYSIPKSNSSKRAIDKSDLDKILNYKFNNPTYNLYLDLYKFSFYTGGINMRDIVTLKRSDIVNGILRFKRSKTSSDVVISLLPLVLDMIEKYKSDSVYLFNLIDNEEAKYLYKEVKDITATVNRVLKMVSDALSIPKFTTYSARHSFATVLMNKGVSIAFISSSLGHMNVSTTQSYLGSFTDQQMQDNMKALTINNEST